MVTKVSLAATILIAFGSCASAQQAMNGEFQRAFGRITNSSGDLLAGLCVDRTAGSASGPVSVSGLTLAMDDGVNSTIENVSGNSGSTMQIAPVNAAMYHNSKVQDQSPEITVLAQGNYFVGFIYDELAAPSALAANFFVHVGGGNSVEGGAHSAFKARRSLLVIQQT